MEYALILVLIAVGAILILSLTGIAIQRLYGVVGGAMGVKKQANGEIQGQIINITGATCLVVAVGSSYNSSAFFDTGYTAYFLKVDTNVPLDQLNTAGSENTLMLNVFTSESTPIAPPAVSSVTFTMDGVTRPDASICPKSAVVQSIQGSIAVSPVEIVQVP